MKKVEPKRFPDHLQVWMDARKKFHWFYVLFPMYPFEISTVKDFAAGGLTMKHSLFKNGFSCIKAII